MQSDHTIIGKRVIAPEVNEYIVRAPVLARKAARTLWETRNPTAMMFAWHSNVNYRNVALAG